MKYLKFWVLATLVILPITGIADGLTDPLEVYRETLAEVERMRQAGSLSSQISHTYVVGAGKARDLGDSKYTEILFESAIEEDPDNANAHRVYGDYLMGYRGLYEWASDHYYRALKIVEANPLAYESGFVNALERSFQIMHRDGKDGMPLYTSDKFSAFLEVGAAYREVPNDPATLKSQRARAARVLDVRAEELATGVAFTESGIAENRTGIDFFETQVGLNDDGIEFFQDQVNGTFEYEDFLHDRVDPVSGPVYSYDEILDFDENGDPFTTNDKLEENEDYRKEVQGRVEDIGDEKSLNQQKIGEIKDAKAANQQKLSEQKGELANMPQQKKDLEKRIPLKRKEYEYYANLLLRFGSPNLPYLRFIALHVDADDVTINPEDLANPYDGKYRRYTALVGKSFRLPRSIDMFIEAEVSSIENELEDPVTDDRVAKEDTTQFGLRLESGINLGFNTAKLKLAGSISDIDNEASNDDSGNAQLVALRFSRYPPAKTIEATPRFKGRRSRHLELGLARTERDYKSPTAPTVTEENYRPYISIEELAMANGNLDLAFVYSFKHGETDGGAFDGTCEVHEFTLLPIWVVVYKLYDSNFWSGLEHFTIGFPLRTAFGDGDYDRWSAGVEVKGRYVTPFGIAAVPTLSGEYVNYTEINENEWGFYAKLVLTSGAKKKFKAPRS